MANIPLKSIKFPDLADTYTVPSNAGELPYDKSATYPADTVGKALQDKPDADGTIANAEQLTSNIYEEDNTPYNFRTSGGSIDIGDRETDMVVGGTVAWNQLVQTTDTSVMVPNGHKYYANINGLQTIGASTGAAISINDGTKDNVIDLTQMFGSTIADYIYSLEQATAGAGVAWFKKLFPKPYYEYNTGELMSVNTSAHNTVGFNAWDEEWEVGQYYDGDGKWNSSGTRVCSKRNNPIKVVPNASYYIGSGTTVIWFDENGKTYNNGAGYIGYAYAPIVTAPSNAKYMRFYKGSSYGTTYKNDICINLSWDGERDGEYEEYVKHSYPLDSDLTLRGIPKLDASNNLYYDGDTYESDGTVTRKYGVVDLGSLTWWKVDNNNYRNFVASLSNAVYDADSPTIVCLIYKSVSANAGASADGDNYIWVRNESPDNGICIKDTSKASMTASDFKSAMSGKYLVYKKQTPTTETADPYTNPQIVNDFGTEEYVDYAVSQGSRDVAIPVGHETQYMANLKAKLEMSPNSPEGAGDYIVRQTNGENEYVTLASNATIQNIIARLEALENAES